MSIRSFQDFHGLNEGKKLKDWQYTGTVSVGSNNAIYYQYPNDVKYYIDVTPEELEDYSEGGSLKKKLEKQWADSGKAMTRDEFEAKYLPKGPQGLGKYLSQGGRMWDHVEHNDLNEADTWTVYYKKGSFGREVVKSGLSKQAATRLYNKLSADIPSEYDGVEMVMEAVSDAQIRKVMKLAKDRPAPFAVVAVKGGKVVAQDIDIKTWELVLAHYREMAKAHPDAKIHVEDAEGQSVMESTLDEASGTIAKGAYSFADYFGIPVNRLKGFKFDGTDDVEELHKVLGRASSNIKGTENIYRASITESADMLPSYEVIVGLATVMGALDLAQAARGGDSIIVDVAKALKAELGDRLEATGAEAKRVIDKFKGSSKVKKIIMDAEEEVNESLTESVNETTLGDFVIRDRTNPKIFLQTYRSGGMGSTWTDDIDKAMVFGTHGSARNLIQQQSYKWQKRWYVQSLKDAKEEVSESKRSTGMKISLFEEYFNEALIGPFFISDRSSDEELRTMHKDAVSGYAYWTKGWEYPKSDYKKAYQEIEKIAKKRGLALESVNEAKSDITPGSRVEVTGQSIGNMDKTLQGEVTRKNSNGTYEVSLDNGDMADYKADELKLIESVNEATETGLMVVPRTNADANKIQKWVDKSGMYGEWDAREGYFLFPEEEDGFDELEAELTKELDKLGVNYHIEGIFESKKSNQMSIKKFESYFGDDQLNEAASGDLIEKMDKALKDFEETLGDLEFYWGQLSMAADKIGKAMAGGDDSKEMRQAWYRASMAQRNAAKQAMRMLK